MKKAPSLLLLVVIAVGSGSLLAPALAQQCSHDSSVKTVNSNVTLKLSRTSTSVYLRPLPGFQGISLTAEASDGEEQTAVFENHHTCFHGDADYWEVSVAAWLSNNMPDDSNHQKLYFRLWSDGCSSQCYSTATVDKIEKLILKGHGPSTWSFSTPDSSCRIVNLWVIHSDHAVRCVTTLSAGTNTTTISGPATAGHANASTGRSKMTTSAATTPPTTASYTLVVVVVVVVLGIVLGVLSVVALRLALLVKKLKKQQTTARHAAPQQVSSPAGGRVAVQFSSLQAHRGDDRSPLYPPLSTHKGLP